MVMARDNLLSKDVESVGLEFLDQGEGEPVVLLHGLGCSAEDWALQMPALSQCYRVIAPSLKGFGGSEKPRGPVSIMQYADDIVELLDALGIVRAHIVGHSMGGAVALQMAVAHPDRLNSLVVVNAQASFAVRDWRRHLVILTRLLAGGSAGMERLSRFLARRLFPGDGQADLREQMVERYPRNDARAYLAAVQALAGWSVETLVDRVATPTLVIAGEYDIAPIERAREFAHRLPRGELRVVPDSGHATPFDQYQRMNALILDFLSTANWGRNTPRTDRRRDVRSPEAASV